MPRLRGNKKYARHDPIFGPAQDGGVAPGFNVPRDISAADLQYRASELIRAGVNQLSIKNQIRAIVAAAGLTSAASGALLLKTYQYIDKKIGKRPRGTDASEEGDDNPRLRGTKKSRTLDPELPDYEEVSSREDEFIEKEGNAFANTVDAAFTMQDDEDVLEQIAEQENQESAVRNVVLEPTGDGDFTIDTRGQHQDSFDDLPSGAQATANQEPHPWDLDNSEFAVDMTDTEMHDISGEETTTNAAARTSASSASSHSMQVTPVAKIAPSFPFHQTTEAILEHFGNMSTVITTAGATDVLRIRMNTYHQPYSETNATISDAVSFTTNPATTYFRQPLGRYVVNRGLTGDIIESLYNRQLRVFSASLFPTGPVSYTHLTLPTKRIV